MQLEQEVFLGKAVVEETLLAYGFHQQDTDYIYQKSFMDEQFTAYIRIDAHGQVYGKVIDNDTQDEYVQVRLASSTGAFVGQVRESYLKILHDIARACFEKQPFLFPQTNRIAKAINHDMHEKPDYPFKKWPSYAVFRYHGNRKWYALIAPIEKSRITKGDDDSIVEIINVKCKPDMYEELKKMKGVFPAYHMNHKNWISIILDETLPDEVILSLLDTSRQMVISPAKASFAWIVPANPKYYDVITAFSQKNDVIWKQSARIQVGDIVYLYVGAPISAVKYKCVVKETDIPYTYTDSNVSMSKIMRMDVLETYPDDVCPFSRLKKLGIRAVRGPRAVTPEFIEYLSNRC